MSSALTPSFTFDALVVGPGNRLAAAAAGRSAEAPGTYNPLVIHGAPGVGKTHLLHAIGHRAREARPKLNLVYETTESFIDRLSRALAEGRMEAFRKECLRIDLLLLDDLQVLAGRVRTQIELLPVWDRMGQNGAQVVLASDRPPTEIDALQARLEARFARLLVVEVQAATPETRTYLALRGLNQAHRAPDDRSTDGAAPAAAAPATADGPTTGGSPEEDPFGSFLSDITATVAEVVDSAPWRAQVAEAILRWGGEGIRTWRLEGALQQDDLEEIETLLARFEADAARLREIARELERIAPEQAGAPVLSDPDRVAEAEALLLGVRLAQQPWPPLPNGRTLASFVGRDGLETSAVALARRVAQGPAAEHNPLFVHGPAERCTHYLAAIGHASHAARGSLPVAYLAADGAAAELGRALEAHQPELWQRRYETASLLLVDVLEAFAADEASQEALLGLLDAVLLRGGQVVLAAGRPWRHVEGLSARLAARLGTAAAVDLSGAAPRRLLGISAGAPVAGGQPSEAEAVRGPALDRFFLDREKLAWDWLALDDRLAEGPA